jgi:hypothetical protein
MTSTPHPGLPLQVTFTDNHDTGAPQNHWPFPPDRQALGYTYILTHPGVPCIFGGVRRTSPR